MKRKRGITSTNVSTSATKCGVSWKRVSCALWKQRKGKT